MLSEAKHDMPSTPRQGYRYSKFWPSSTRKISTCATLCAIVQYHNLDQTRFREQGGKRCCFNMPDGSKDFSILPLPPLSCWQEPPHVARVQPAPPASQREHRSPLATPIPSPATSPRMAKRKIRATSSGPTSSTAAAVFSAIPSSW